MPDIQYITGDARDKLATLIQGEAVSRPKFWKDRDDIMDRDMLLRLMVDEEMDRKSTGFARFKTNWGSLVVDRPEALMVGNPMRFQIPLEGDPREQRDKKSMIERFSKGVWNDIDLSLRDRGNKAADAIIAEHLLSKGMAVSELIMSEEEQKRRGSPVKYQWWDPRFTYPYYDQGGLNSVEYCITARMGDVMLEYEDAPMADSDPETVVKKYIWYDRERYGVLCEWVPRGSAYRRLGGKRQQTWLVEPYQHELDKIPVTITPANQISTISIPNFQSNGLDPNGTGLTRNRGARNGHISPSGVWCRSIFWNIANAIPQFNNLTATMLQVIKAGAFGTWVIKTQDGEPILFDIGSGTQNFTDLMTQVDRIEPSAPPPGLGEMMQLYSKELQLGSVPAELMMSAQGASSGFDRAQMISVALGSLGSFMAAHTSHCEELTQSAIAQYAGKKAYSMTARGYESKTPFKQTINGADIDQYYDIRIKRQLALPDDMAGRLGMARQAQDPAAMLMDIWTVLDEILEVEDPDLIIDRMWEQKAWQFPPIAMQMLKQGLTRLGAAPEALQTVDMMEAIAQYQLQAQQIQGQGTVTQMQSALAAPGQAPSALPPEQANPNQEMMTAQMQAGMPQGGQPAPVIYGPNGQPLAR